MGTLDVHNEAYDQALADVSHIVITGNVVDGIALHGPFTSFEDATDWAEQNCDEWHVVEISNVTEGD